MYSLVMSSSVYASLKIRNNPVFYFQSSPYFTGNRLRNDWEIIHVIIGQHIHGRKYINWLKNNHLFMKFAMFPNLQLYMTVAFF